MLFETYQRFDALSASGERLLRALAPTLLGALLVLLLFQVPLAWSLARRLQRGHRERERLLARTIEASDHERRRIAADLHDGVVQDLAGVAFGLAPLAEGAQRRGDEAEAAALRESTTRLRQGVRALRTLLVEIHPPRLETAGLEPVLDDLLSPLAASGDGDRAAGRRRARPRGRRPIRWSTAWRARRCATSPSTPGRRRSASRSTRADGAVTLDRRRRRPGLRRRRAAPSAPARATSA